MNVAVMVSSLSYGGAEKQAVADANMLSEKCRTWLVSFSDGAQKGAIAPGVNHLLLTKKSYPRTTFALMRLIRKHEIEVVHAFLFASSIIAALASLLVPVKVVWHFHSHEYDAPILSRLAFTVLSRLPSVVAITFVNNELRDNLMGKFRMPREKVRLLYNSASVEVLDRKLQGDAKTVIGYVGRLVELKRVNYLIDLAAALFSSKISNFEIWIVGDGDQISELKAATKKRKLGRYIKFCGFQAHLSEFYQQFDIFVLPSREECLSIALIDAGVTGVPSVAFNVGGNDEIIVDGSTGYLVETKDEMIERTRELVSDPHLRSRFGENARLYCGSRFSAEARKRRLVGLGTS